MSRRPSGSMPKLKVIADAISKKREARLPTLIPPISTVQFVRLGDANKPATDAIWTIWAKILLCHLSICLQKENKPYIFMPYTLEQR